jgi:hypothetical protein
MGTDEHGDFAFCIGGQGLVSASRYHVEAAMRDKPRKVEVFSFFANNRRSGGAE